MTKIPKINTSSWTTTATLFSECYKLTEIPQIDTSNATNMGSMFNECRSLKTAPRLNMSKVTSTQSMFYNCSSLEEVTGLDTSKVINMGTMFSGCKNLITVQELDASNATTISTMFSGCTKFKNFGGLKNVGKAFTSKSANNYSYTLTYTQCTELTHESLMNIINGLYDLNLTYDVANGGTLYTQTLKLGSTNLAKLTEEEIAIATSKGWNVT